MSCFAVRSDSRWGTNFSVLRQGRTAPNILRHFIKELSKLLRYVALINKCFEQACHHICDGPLLSSRSWHHRWLHIAGRHHLSANSLAALSAAEHIGYIRVFLTCSFLFFCSFKMCQMASHLPGFKVALPFACSGFTMTTSRFTGSKAWNAV